MVFYEEDYEYITPIAKQMIDKGLAKYDLYGLRIYDGSYPDRLLQESQEGQRLEIAKLLTSGGMIVYGLDNSISYRSMWDVFNGTNHINFNTKKTIEERYADLERIKTILSCYDGNIRIVIQYTQQFDTEELKKCADNFFVDNKNKFIQFANKEGKLKEVPIYMDSYYGSVCNYGFFPKGNRTNYYKITNMEIAAMV